MSDDLKKLGLFFKDLKTIELYYSQLKGIFVQQLGSKPNRGMVLDLNSLPSEPVDFKGAVIKWLISVNLERIKQGLEPIIELGLVLQCPVWKVVKPPLRKLELSQEKMFNKPSAIGKKINQRPKTRGINR